MPFRSKLIAAVAVLVLALPVRSAFAADDLARVLHELDVSAANFRSTSADFQFDTYQTDPIPEKDTQRGVAFYERKGTAFQMSAHIAEMNGKASPRTYTYAAGVLRLFEPLVDQVTSFKSAGKFESYLMLGFGASGKDLADKWEITYQGPEPLDGIKTEKLELVAKDPTIRKNLPKVTVWIDTTRGVSLKQVFDQGQGQTRVCVYFNIKVNQALPADAFKFKTDSKTQFVEH
ncbi:MAG: outer membrane lipoprotein-sorting protein [Terracidiphilus sp.]|nr:outer membrane lipoprotein-sorting protein [Terracidiphilus sp.]